MVAAERRAAPTEHEHAVREDTAFWMNPEDIEIPEDIPTPQLWRLMVVPIQPKRMSKGGIALPDVAIDNVELLTNIGKVVAMGPMAGKKPEWAKWPWWAQLPLIGHLAKPRYPYLEQVKVGSLVIMGQYAGQRFEFRGLKAVLLNDDEVLGVAKTVEGFRVYI